jgi:hypothetical protein
MLTSALRYAVLFTFLCTRFISFSLCFGTMCSTVFAEDIITCRGLCVTNNNGFCIGCFDLLALLLQSLLITFAYNSSHSMTAEVSLHSFLDYECLLSRLSSAVTDLVLIYESITSSVSVARWLTLTAEHSTLL